MPSHDHVSLLLIALGLIIAVSILSSYKFSSVNVSFFQGLHVKNGTADLPSETAPLETEKKLTKRPNVLIVMSDQLNFRTLGCYRNQLTHKQAFVWGDNVVVETPNIDSLAAEGALYTNFMVTFPQCTPSRASFMTGMYPRAVGAQKNGSPLKHDARTFAHVLQNQGYYTAYVGKWHLNGQISPGWSTHNTSRPFGFDNIYYQYNSGMHVGIKQLFEEGDRIYEQSFDPLEANETNYVTDFLFDRSIKILSDHVASKNEQPFLLMLSVPDPHTPYDVRAPYNTMFQNLTFQWPNTLTQTYNGSAPNFKNRLAKDDTLPNTLRMFDEQRPLRQYFGMVKCLDDNMGKLLKYLEETGLYNDTIVVFTSDHGAMLGEHGDMTKGEPFKTSLTVPFIIRYPGFIKPNKVIHTAHINIDFAPTLLKLMDIDISHLKFHGENGADELLSSSAVSADENRMVVSITGFWASVVNLRFKLVLSSSSQTPWLFDSAQDPDEIVNYYSPTHPLSQRMFDYISQKSVRDKFGGEFFFLNQIIKRNSNSSTDANP